MGPLKPAVWKFWWKRHLETGEVIVTNLGSNYSPRSRWQTRLRCRRPNLHQSGDLCTWINVALIKGISISCAGSNSRANQCSSFWCRRADEHETPSTCCIFICFEETLTVSLRLFRERIHNCFCFLTADTRTEQNHITNTRIILATKDRSKHSSFSNKVIKCTAQVHTAGDSRASEAL